MLFHFLVFDKFVLQVANNLEFYHLPDRSPLFFEGLPEKVPTLGLLLSNMAPQWS